MEFSHDADGAVSIDTMPVESIKEILGGSHLCRVFTFTLRPRDTGVALQDVDELRVERAKEVAESRRSAWFHRLRVREAIR